MVGVVSPAGRGDVGGGVTGGGDLHIPPPEQDHTVHYDKAHYGPVSGGKGESWVKVGKLVVGTGRFGIVRDADGNLGGRTGGGGG